MQWTASGFYETISWHVKYINDHIFHHRSLWFPVQLTHSFNHSILLVQISAAGPQFCSSKLPQQLLSTSLSLYHFISVLAISIPTSIST